MVIMRDKAGSDVVAGGGSVPPVGRRLQLSRRQLRLVAGVVLLLIVVAGAWYLLTPRLSEPEQKAVDASRKAAQGFDEKDKQYSYTQLNNAVVLAHDKKCVEARAVFADTEDHPNGIPGDYMQRVKKRIEASCSGVN